MGTRQLNASTADFVAALVGHEIELALKPDEFTVYDYRREHYRQTGEEMTRRAAETRLHRLEKEGKIVRRDELAFHNGRYVIAYRKTDETNT